jgi:hypothetical protein
MIQYLQCHELLRKDIEADKVLMMTALVELTDEQGTAH